MLDNSLIFLLLKILRSLRLCAEINAYDSVVNNDKIRLFIFKVIIMPLSDSQRRHLRKLAHDLKPLVIVGQAGLTENVINEIDTTLAHHELIKVRINAGDKAARQAIIDQIVAQTGSEWVLSIGHICAIYRPAEKPKIELPK